MVAPAAIVTGAPWMLTIPAGKAARETDIPPGGAGALSVTVPLTVRVKPTVCAEKATDRLGVVTLTVAKPGRKPGMDAEIRVTPWPVGVTVKVALVEFGGTVTVEGTVATVGTRLARLTT